MNLKTRERLLLGQHYPGAQTLQTDHDNNPIRGVLRFQHAPDGLDFTFVVHDTHCEAATFCAGCAAANAQAVWSGTCRNRTDAISFLVAA